MKRFAVALVLAALTSVPASAKNVTVLNTWQEVMESNWNALSSFCTTDTAHPVVTWLLGKDAEARFVVKTWDPSGKKAKFMTEWTSMSAGSHVTCLACQFGFQEHFPATGVYKMRVKVQAKRAGSAGDLYRFDVGSCAAAAGVETPATPHH